VPGAFGHAYSGYVAADGRIFDPNIRTVAAWPEFKRLPGQLPGQPKFGMIHSPSVADGRVYLRGRTNIYCWDFRKNPPANPDRVGTPAQPAAADLTALKDNVPELAALAAKPDWPARAAAAERLQELGENARPAAAAVHQALMQALQKKDWGDCDLLAATLVSVDPSRAKELAPEIAKLLDARDWLSVRLGCHLLRMLGPDAEATLAPLKELLRSEDRRIVIPVLKVLNAIGPKAADAGPSVLALLDKKDEELTFQALKATLHMGAAPAQALPAFVDQVQAHPWMVRIPHYACVLPRYSSYPALLLTLLGPERIPFMFEKARAELKNANAEKIDYLRIAELVEAAHVLDPNSAEQGLAVLEAALKRAPGWSKGSLTLVQTRLKGVLPEEAAEEQRKANPPVKGAGRKKAAPKTN